MGRNRLCGIGLIVAGLMAAIGSCLTWRTTSSTLPDSTQFVAERVRGLHYTQLGSSTIGFGDLTLLVGVLAIGVGAYLVVRPSPRLPVAALVGCAAIVFALALRDVIKDLRAPAAGSLTTHVQAGMWLTIAGGTLLIAAGITCLTAPRLQKVHRGHRAR